jgi:hypothetical protein
MIHGATKMSGDPDAALKSGNIACLPGKSG